MFQITTENDFFCGFLLEARSLFRETFCPMFPLFLPSYLPCLTQFLFFSRPESVRQFVTPRVKITNCTIHIYLSLLEEPVLLQSLSLSTYIKHIWSNLTDQP